jgi:hypothetical protein
VLDDPRREQPKMWRIDATVDSVWTLVLSDLRLCVRLIAEEGYGNLSGGKNLNYVLTRGFSALTVPLLMMC